MWRVIVEWLKLPVNKFPLGAVMILVESTNRIHYNAPSEIQQRMKFKINRSKFNIDFLCAVFKLNFRKEFYSPGNGGGDKQGKASHLKLMSFTDTIGAQMLPISFYIATNGNR